MEEENTQNVIVTSGDNESQNLGNSENMSKFLSNTYPHASIETTYAQNSSFLSEYMLDTYNQQPWYGAFVLGDKINVTLDVDWEEVKSAIHFAMPYIEPYFEESTVLDEDVIKYFLSNKYVISYLFNMTRILSQLPNYKIINHLGESVENAGIDLEDLDYVNTDSIEVVWTNRTVKVENLKIGSAKNNINLGDPEFNWPPINDTSFINQLPNDTEIYRFDLKTDSTIIHNKKSHHAVAVYNQAYNDYLYDNCTN